MDGITIGLSVIFFLALFIGGAFMFLRSRRTSENSGSNQSSPIEDGNSEIVLTFPDSRKVCQTMVENMIKSTNRDCNRTFCGLAHEEEQSGLLRIINTLLLAKESIEVCFYNIAHELIANVLIFKHVEKIKLRIITNNKCDDKRNDKIPKLHSAGIMVKTNSVFNGGKMHNKFFIVDRSIVIHGSANCSNNGYIRNDEKVVISSRKSTVDNFADNFDRLWNNYQNNDWARTRR